MKHYLRLFGHKPKRIYVDILVLELVVDHLYIQTATFPLVFLSTSRMLRLALQLIRDRE